MLAAATAVLVAAVATVAAVMLMGVATRLHSWGGGELRVSLPCGGALGLVGSQCRFHVSVPLCLVAI
jgi:hypothetical protein